MWSNVRNTFLAISTLWKPTVSIQLKFRLQKRYFCQMFSCYQTVISKFVIFCWHSWWGLQIFMANLKLYTIYHIGVRRIMIEIVERETFMSNLTLYTVCHNCSSFEPHFHIVIRRIMVENVEREVFIPNLTLYTVCHNFNLLKLHFHIVICWIMVENVEREIFISNLTLYTVYHMAEIVVCRNRIL